MSEPAASPEPTAPRPGSTRTGPGRLLVAIYALFALSASARAGVQIATKFSHAPVAYLLSAFAAVVYILATVTLTVGSPTARRIAVLSCSVELVGVLAVGTWSLADPATFPDATVWSGYGSGYGFVPLVLPVFGLLWLSRWTGRPRIRRTIATSSGDAGEAAGDGVAHGEGGAPGQYAEDVVADGKAPRTLSKSRNALLAAVTATADAQARRPGAGEERTVEALLAAGRAVSAYIATMPVRSGQPSSTVFGGRTLLE